MLSIEDCLALKLEIESKFCDLKFDEPSHTYTVNGIQHNSVSKEIEHFCVPFNDIDGSVDYANKRGLDPIHVLNAWHGENKISTDFGHGVHTFGEEYALSKYHGIGPLPSPRNLCELGIVQWFHDMIDESDYLFPLVLELKMYHKDFPIAGTADVTLIDRRDSNLIIADHKTNKDLFKGMGVLLPPFDCYTDIPLHHYYLQLSYYQLMIERIGYKVKERVVMWYRKDPKTQKLYQNFRTPDHTYDILRCLEKKYKV